VEGDCGVLFMELCTGGTLADLEGKLSEAECAYIMQALLGLCTRAAGVGWLHGDLKPENVLLTADGGLRLGDWGCGAQLVEGRADRFLGTRAFIAPEVLLRPASHYDAAADVYSAARTIVRLHDQKQAWSPVGLVALGLLQMPDPEMRADGAHQMVLMWYKQWGLRPGQPEPPASLQVKLAAARDAWAARRAQHGRGSVQSQQEAAAAASGP
jgi:serine/threonine protein kinase